MKNLELLKNHKKRVCILLSLLIFIFLYVWVVIFQFTSSYITNENQNKALELKAQTIQWTIESLWKNYTFWDVMLNAFLDEIFTDTYIYTSNAVIIDSIKFENFDEYIFPPEVVSIIEGKKFYKTSMVSNQTVYNIIVTAEYKDILQKVWMVFAILLLVAPFIFMAIYYSCKKIIKKIYRPLWEMIVNLESFAGNINHEFKTGLTEIISSLELAKEIQNYEESNDFAVQSAYRLNSTLDTLGMLIHFANSDYRKQKINLVKLIDECLRDFDLLLDEHNISVTKKYNPKKPIIKYMDIDPVILVFQNLMKNAIKYSHPNSTINIYLDKDYLQIKDYWVWIEKENLDKIFDRYFRESYAEQWSGIGLSIIKHITKIYKWDIKIESEKDVYTKVTVYFHQNNKK